MAKTALACGSACSGSVDNQEGPLGSDGYAPGANVNENDGQFRVDRYNVDAYDNYGVRFAERMYFLKTAG
jgi:hypothetical protein